MENRIQRRRLIAGLICIVILASTVSLVHAQQTGAIWTTYDNNPTHTVSQFADNQIVYIFWSVSGPVHIVIYDNYGNVVADSGSLLSTQPVIWQIPSNLASGIYYAVIPGQGYYPIAVASIYVVPESVWGTLTVTTAGFAAFGAFGIFKINRKKQDKEIE